MNIKKELGQYYTTRSDYILQDMSVPQDCALIEPFAGTGELQTWANRKMECYDLDPKLEGVVKRDTLMNPPIYEDKFVITNPPYLASNKSKNRVLFDKWNEADMYKCFIHSIVEGNAAGGIVIIPLNFLSDRDTNIRKLFFSKYKVETMNVFEERVFDDTDYTVCSIQFSRRQDVGENALSFKARVFPSQKEVSVLLSEETRWRIAGHLFEKVKSRYKITRLLKGEKPTTGLLLRAIDTGGENGRISLTPNQDPFFGKISDRTFATISTNIPFDEAELAKRFNEQLEMNRKMYHSLFLTNYRNSSKLYSRKRISFTLAFNLIKRILSDMENNNE